MNLVNTHNHRLVFCLDGDAPEKYIKKWNKFKQQCEGGNNKYILEQIKQNCKIKSNKKLQYLDREEGGLGGNDNTIHKQIRFRHIFMGFVISVRNANKFRWISYCGVVSIHFHLRNK